MATVAELRDRAAEMGLTVPARARKAEIERIIAEAEEPVTVVAAVERDLERLGRLDARLARSPEAATALALARELDSRNSATSKSMCARALNETLERLREQAPDADEGDGLDELAAKRAARRAAS